MTLPNRAPENSESFVEERVVLVVPASVNTPQLFRFLYQLDQNLRDNHASIVNTFCSWDWGTFITVQLPPNELFNFLGNLGNIPEVEEVEEEPLARDGFSSFPKKFGALRKSSLNPSKSVRLTLKETDTGEWN